MSFSDNDSYWIHLIQKLSEERELNEMIRDVLGDLCNQFDYGCGFVYKQENSTHYVLQAKHERYPNPKVVEQIDLATIYETDPHTWVESVIYYDPDTVENPAIDSLAKYFGTKRMLFLPIADEKLGLMAFIGLTDRRSSARAKQDHTLFTQSILKILGNYIKMQIYQQRTENAQRSLEDTLDHMGIDVYVNDFENHEILYLNRSMAAPYGSVEEMTGRVCYEALYEDKTCECEFCPQKKLLDENGNPTKVYSWDYKRPFDGSWFRVFSAAMPWVNGRTAHIVSSVDITENKRNEEIIRMMAEYDHLTNLPNRYAMNNFIDLLFKDTPNPFVVIFFDLDGFKKLNDTEGHKAGDELLHKIGTFLRETPVFGEKVYRYGGDEFVVVVDDYTPEKLGQVIGTLRKAFSTPWVLDDGTLAHVGASIGMSQYPTDGDQGSTLIRNADYAMYEAKRVKDGTIFVYNQGHICPMDKLTGICAMAK